MMKAKFQRRLLDHLERLALVLGPIESGNGGTDLVPSMSTVTWPRQLPLNTSMAIFTPRMAPNCANSSRTNLPQEFLGVRRRKGV